MLKYLYSARDERGKLVKGIMLAENEVELANKISHLGYFLTSYKTSKELSKKTSKAKTKLSALTAKEVLQLTYQLATLLDAGLPLLEGLRNLAQDASSERTQLVVDDVRYRIESGISFKEALSFHPDTFSRVYQALVNAGENTGNLPEVLNELTWFLEWQMELRAKIREAATYPVILFCVMLIVVALLVVKVIPTFEPIFAEAGAALPLPTKIVLAVSHFVRDFWYVLLGIIGSAVAGYIFYNRTEEGRYRLDSLKLKIPFLGLLIRKIALSRFARTFTICFESGISLLTALNIARGTIGNARIEMAVTKASESVNVGEKLAVSLQMTGEFPAMVVRMIGVGEQSGALPQTLRKVANFYDKEVAAAIKAIFALLEPMMIIIMGVVVGGIALAIFLPMFQLSQMMG